MRFRYFDPAGNQLAPEQLRSMGVVTPAMGHVLAAVLERLEKAGKSGEPVEKDPAE